MNRRLRSLRLAAAFFFITSPFATRAADSIPHPVELWPGGAPGATGSLDEDRPSIYPFLPASEKSTGTAVLVCPGGGFMTRCADHEGVLIARWFQSRGVAAFVLRYRVVPIATMDQSVEDALRGIRYLRANAEGYHIAPDRIGIIGFSAGAGLASNAALKAQPGTSDAADPIDRVSSRPDFQVLAYGSTGVGRREGRGSDDSTPKEPPSWSNMPPSFLYCTSEDNLVDGMVSLYSNLRKAGVPVEAHFFAHGVHGVGFAQGDPVLGEWPRLLHNWLRVSGLLTGATRVALRGVVTVDGQP